MAKHNAVLTDEIVLEMRAEVRATKRMNVRGYAAKYGVSHPTIHYALVGKTFKHLPDPISAGEVDKGGKGRKPIMTSEQIDEVVALRRQNPSLWPYAVLAQRCNRLYGTHYRPSNVQRIIASRCGDEAARPKEAPARKPVSKQARIVLPKVVPRGHRQVDIASKEGRLAAVEKIIAMRNKNA